MSRSPAALFEIENPDVMVQDTVLFHPSIQKSSTNNTSSLYIIPWKSYTLVPYIPSCLVHIIVGMSYELVPTFCTLYMQVQPTWGTLWQMEELHSDSADYLCMYDNYMTIIVVIV